MPGSVCSGRLRPLGVTEAGQGHTRSLGLQPARPSHSPSGKARGGGGRLSAGRLPLAPRPGSCPPASPTPRHHTGAGPEPHQRGHDPDHRGGAGRDTGLEGCSFTRLAGAPSRSGGPSPQTAPSPPSAALTEPCSPGPPRTCQSLPQASGHHADIQTHPESPLGGVRMKCQPRGPPPPRGRRMSEGSSLQPPTAPQGRRQGLSHTVRVPLEWEHHVPLTGGLDARRGLAGLVVEPLWGGVSPGPNQTAHGARRPWPWVSGTKGFHAGGEASPGGPCTRGPGRHEPRLPAVLPSPSPRQALPRGGTVFFPRLMAVRRRQLEMQHGLVPLGLADLRRPRRPRGWGVGGDGGRRVPGGAQGQPPRTGRHRTDRPRPVATSHSSRREEGKRVCSGAWGRGQQRPLRGAGGDKMLAAPRGGRGRSPRGRAGQPRTAVCARARWGLTVTDVRARRDVTGRIARVRCRRDVIRKLLGLTSANATPERGPFARGVSGGEGPHAPHGRRWH